MKQTNQELTNARQLKMCFPGDVICAVCCKTVKVTPSRIKNLKRGLVTCSMYCRGKLFAGKNNPNYGMKGELHPNFYGKVTRRHGYLWEYCPTHPFADKRGRILQHRLFVEMYLLTPETTIFIDGKGYLNPAFEVHHINFDKGDNTLENLQVLTKANHCRLHVIERHARRRAGQKRTYTK